ncbi:YaaR family protein [Paenibacillus chitinolyticus]|uniref:YaaR family protein n=1 Tax=Paenibacillus chitinolyticus TaxID=79263 RepID=UPI0036DA4D2A
MKINPGWQPIGKNVKVPETAPTHQSPPKDFSAFMLKHDEKVTTEQLNRMLQQIGLQGDRLSRSMKLRELRQYKLLIKQFLEETARQGVGLRETRGWDRRGRTKRYKLLEEVDGALLSMADDLLETEQGRLEILQRIGEIRGMLIHFLF